MPMTSPRMLLSLVLPEVTPVVPGSVNFSATDTCVSGGSDRYVVEVYGKFLTTLVNGSIAYRKSTVVAIQDQIQRGEWKSAITNLDYVQQHPFNQSIASVISLIAHFEVERGLPDDVIRATWRVDPKYANEVTDMCNVITGLARLMKSLVEHTRWSLIDEFLLYAQDHYRSGSRRGIAKLIDKRIAPLKTYKRARKVNPWIVWRTPTLDKLMV